MRQYSRRTVLRRGSAGAVGTMAASAGCLSRLSPFGNEGSSYSDWLYAPSKNGDADRYTVVRFEPTALEDNEKHLSDSLDELRASADEHLGSIQYDSIDSVLKMDGSYVIQGSYTKSDVVSALEQDGFTEQDTHSGYTIYTHGWGLPVAISDSTLLFVEESGPTSDTEILRSIIDAKQGDTKRYGDQNEAFETLSSHLSGDVIWSGVSQSPMSSLRYSPLARIDGESLEIDGESTEHTRVYVLGDDAENASDVKENARSNASDGVSFSQEDNVLIAEMTRSTEEIDIGHVLGSA